MLACDLGVFSNIHKWKFCSEEFSVLDIGAGYGMLKDYLFREFSTHAKYTGVDVYPKFEGVLPVSDCILPDEVMQNKFVHVFAINVFQHLSCRQRVKYYSQVRKICSGMFVMTMCFDDPKNNICGFRCKENGRRYICHYGQFTLLPYLSELYDEVSEHFHIRSIKHETSMPIATFYLIPREFPKPEPTVSSTEVSI
jgi:hypothetical protein